MQNFRILTQFWTLNFFHCFLSSPWSLVFSHFFFLLMVFSALFCWEKLLPRPTLLAESFRSFLDKAGKRKRLRFLPLPDLSRKIEGDSVRRVAKTLRIVKIFWRKFKWVVEQDFAGNFLSDWILLVWDLLWKTSSLCLSYCVVAVHIDVTGQIYFWVIFFNPSWESTKDKSKLTWYYIWLQHKQDCH